MHSLILFWIGHSASPVIGYVYKNPITLGLHVYTNIIKSKVQDPKRT